ncbi:MAG: hypothetical protein U1E78_12145 [Gammaproteobacteria bacterium]
MIFRVGAGRSRRRSVHKVHDCGENREGNNPENSGVKGIDKKLRLYSQQLIFQVPAYPLTSFRLGSLNFERTRRTDKQLRKFSCEEYTLRI